MDTQIGERLKIARSELGWSQQRAADAVGVRREMWAKYEAGSEPGAKAIAGMIRAGIDVSFVLTGQSADKPHSSQPVLYTEHEVDKAVRKMLVAASMVDAIKIPDEKTFELIVMMTLQCLQKISESDDQSDSEAELRKA